MPLLEISHLTCLKDDGEAIFNDVNLELHEGESVWLCDLALIWPAETCSQR